jgi:Skp family chaperone for outer membrane proteins
VRQRNARLLPVVALLLLAGAGAVRAEAIACLDSDKVRTNSTSYKRLSEMMDNLYSDLRAQLQARSEFEHLPLADADTAAALRYRKTKGEKLTKEEDQALTDLAKREDALRAEFNDLIRKTQPTDAENNRTMQLRDAKKQNAEAIQTKRETLQTQLQTRYGDLRALFEKNLSGAIEKACRDAGATACIPSSIPVYEPLGEGIIVPIFVPLVFWGARDVTDQVTKLLDLAPLNLSESPASGEWGEVARTIGPALPGHSLDPASDRRDTAMSLPGTLRTALPLLATALATAAQAQGIAFLDMYSVQRDATPYKNVAEQRAQFEAERNDEYAVRSGFRFIVDAEADRAAELQLKRMKNQELTAQESTELEGLVQKNSQAEIAFEKLATKQEKLTDDEQKQLQALTNVKKAREDTLKALAAKLGKDIAEMEKGLYGKIEGVLEAAVEQASKKAGATVCLQRSIIVWEPSEDGRSMVPVRLPLAHWGGVDVTQDVITILNQSPPPP